MHFQLNEFISLSVCFIITAVLIGISAAFTGQAQASAFKERDIKAFSEELKEMRGWSVYEGVKTGADVVDFITRHKDVCDIVIQDFSLVSNAKISAYLTADTLIMGLADKKNIPEKFWDITFVYDNIIGGNGERIYTAVLLYNGQIQPEYNGATQVRGRVRLREVMFTAV